MEPKPIKTTSRALNHQCQQSTTPTNQGWWRRWMASRAQRATYTCSNRETSRRFLPCNTTSYSTNTSIGHFVCQCKRVPTSRTVSHSWVGPRPVRQVRARHMHYYAHRKHANMNPTTPTKPLSCTWCVPLRFSIPECSDSSVPAPLRDGHVASLRWRQHVQPTQRQPALGKAPCPI